MAKIIDNYILIEAIGQGTFGEIHKGRNLISKEAVAVKTIKLDRFLNDTNLRDKIINEIQALKKLEDQYIVRMIKMLKSANNIYLVYEYLNGGSLEIQLQEKGRMTEQEVRGMMVNIFKGFKTLHHEKIIHRNVNPNNFFLNDGVVKIKNFFCCKSPATQKLFEPENYLYASPEVLLKTQLPQYEEKCDIFSLGLVFHKMLFGTLPFSEEITVEELCELYRNQEFAINCAELSEQMAHILNGMLQIDQGRRIEWNTLFHEEQVPSLSGLVNSTNNNFASNYQVNSQVSQFDTIGQQNFYISQQSVINHVSASPNELLKRRTTISDKENQKQMNKENGENAQVFAKTMEKESNQSVNKQIQQQLMEMRNKLCVTLQGISRIEQMDNWIAKIKTEICVTFLIKKAIKQINDMLDVCQNPDRQWSISKNKNEIVKLLQKDYEDLMQQFRSIKQIVLYNIKQNNCPHEELNTHDFIDEQYVDNVLVMIAKQIAMDLGQIRSSIRSNSQIKSSVSYTFNIISPLIMNNLVREMEVLQKINRGILINIFLLYFFLIQLREQKIPNLILRNWKMQNQWNYLNKDLKIFDIIMNEIQVVKIIIVGDSNVGKTSLLLQFCLQQFNQHQSPTIGCDFSTKLIKKEGTQLKLQLWDVAGQEKFQHLSKLFIRGAKGCIVVSDINNQDSLEHAIQWKNIIADQEEVPVFLIQNKTDLIKGNLETFQTIEYLQDFALKNQFTKCYQMSVKSNDLVELLFYDLVDAMIERGTLKLEESIIKSSFHLDNSVRPNTKHKHKDCC